MNLTDHEILELNELCGAVVDGTLTDAQRTRLAGWLRESEAACRYYVRALHQSASLHSYAAELHAEFPDAAHEPVRRAPVVAWTFAALAAAAAIAIGMWAGLGGRPEAQGGGIESRLSPLVARITAVKDAQWRGTMTAGEPLRRGQRVELGGGYAEITFDSGARVVLEGEALLEINSAWDATLRRGTLKASVPPQAIGFRISNPAVEVVDLGTEFTMVADVDGTADVFVLKGEVEAASRAADQDVIYLRENEARRFDPAGVSDVSDQEARFAQFSVPLDFERFGRGMRFVRWSFDEIEGASVPGMAGGGLAGDFDVRLESPAGARSTQVEGHLGRALRFDGQFFGQIHYPGISDDGPRTVSFWVRVPTDAPLSDAYSMVAWIPRAPKLANRPVGISWNRDPAEGPVGALRTDFAGGCAMGMTSLRDGEWHHVAVCLTVGAAEAPMQVRQYVDGRLESSGIIPGRTRGPASHEKPALQDHVWVGTRLKTNGPQQQRFKGDIDELFIADRGLDPDEIVHLMRTNAVPETALAVIP
ncbi:MAG: LamG-like jellyroll fold domain-containing protein [Opitutus sp.]